MKKMILTTIVLLAATVSQAASVKSEKLQVSPSSIDQSIRLVDKNEPGSSQKKLSIITTDNGMSTDVSPRYKIYLGYRSNAEMGNISADFLISEGVQTLDSAKRISGGIYEVKATVYDGGVGMKKVTLRIDATKMFSDENAARKACGEDFCDIEQLDTSIEVSGN